MEHNFVLIMAKYPKIQDEHGKDSTRQYKLTTSIFPKRMGETMA